MDLSIKELQEIGSYIGSDVPFCINGGTARAFGRGELLEQLDNIPNCNILVFKPNIGISTQWAYKQFIKKKSNLKHPNMFPITKDIKSISFVMGNIFEDLIGEKYPQIYEIKRTMIKNGALTALMSGSGTAVFGIFEPDNIIDKSLIKILEKKFQGQGFNCKPIKNLLN